MIVENIPLGADHRLRKQVEGLLGSGYRVSVITMRSPENASFREIPGLDLLEHPPPPESGGAGGYAREYGLAFFWASLLLARLRLRGRIDVMQVCQPPDIYFPICWILRWGGTRIVVDQRDLMPELLAARYDNPPRVMTQILGWLERRTQRVAHHSIAVNDWLRDRLVGAGAPPDRVSVVRNGPVLARTTNARPEAQLKRDHRYLVCWVGKMGRQDRVDLVLQVVDHLVRELNRTDCGFALLGDGECLDELKQLTGELGLARWVTFTGWRPEAEVFRYLATSDLGLDTSLQEEVSPVKAMEYMAFGLPIVCFDLQETRLTTGEAATLVRPGDAAAAARAIAGLLDDVAAREKMAALGRSRVRDELAWELQCPVYLDAIAGRPGSAASGTPREQ